MEDPLPYALPAAGSVGMLVPAAAPTTLGTKPKHSSLTSEALECPAPHLQPEVHPTCEISPERQGLKNKTNPQTSNKTNPKLKTKQQRSQHAQVLQTTFPK